MHIAGDVAFGDLLLNQPQPSWIFRSLILSGAGTPGVTLSGADTPGVALCEADTQCFAIFHQISRSLVPRYYLTVSNSSKSINFLRTASLAPARGLTEDVVLVVDVVVVVT